MHEIVINLHMHTRYSDGTGLHRDLAQAAIRAGLDALIVTDHNVWVEGVEGYYGNGDQRVLLLVGEEVHDRTRDPQKNHLLVFGAQREMAPYADDPQRLIQAVQQAGGLAFIAHPHDPAAPTFAEPDISWVDWDVTGYHGLELWNAMSEFKGHLRSWAHAIYYAFQFHRVAVGPYPEAIRRWDALLAQGKRVVAIAGSDAHALRYEVGPIHKILFPYEWHFRAINTHLLLPIPLQGEVSTDRALIYEALRQGRAFLANDLLHPARGFRFTAHGHQREATLGESIPLNGGVTLKARLPAKAEIHLRRYGEVIQTWKHHEIATYTVTQPGAYRLEAYLFRWGRKRTWIISNPIYISPFANPDEGEA